MPIDSVAAESFHSAIRATLTGKWKEVEAQRPEWQTPKDRTTAEDRSTRPKGFKYLGLHAVGVSNADSPGWIDKGCEQALTSEPVYCSHAGLNFHGYCWFENGKFHEEVWRFNEPVASYSGDTLREVVDQVCAEFGGE